MTISTTSSSVTNVGNGSTTVWNFSFVADQASDLEVLYTDSSGNVTTLNPSVYSITINTTPVGELWGIGGTVTYPLSGSPISAGTTLTINRIVPYTQDISIGNQGAFYPQAVEQGLDVLELQIQQIENKSDRDVRAPVTDLNPQMELPTAIIRANQYLSFDSSGNVTVTAVAPPSGSIPIVVTATVATLKAIVQADLLPNILYFVEGYTTANDGGEGFFTVTTSSPGADNGGTIIWSNTSGYYFIRVYLGQTIDPKMFGAKGDGSTNDSTAIQAVSNLLSTTGGAQYFTYSTRYNFSTGQTIPGAVYWKGDGKYGTPIRYTGASTAITAQGSANFKQLGISDLYLQMSTNNAVGIDASTFQDAIIKDVIIARSAGGVTGLVGIKANVTNLNWECFFNVVDRCTFDTLGTGLTFQSVISQYPTRWRINNCTFIDGATDIDLQKCNGMHITGYTSSEATVVGIKVGANAAQTLIMGCTFESSQAGPVPFLQIDPAANQTTIIGYQVPAGATGTASCIGTRGTLLGIWGEGLRWSGATVTSPDFQIYVDDDTGIKINGAKAITGYNSKIVAVQGWAGKQLGLTYSASISSDASLATTFIITATDTSAFTISNPTNGAVGQRIKYTIRNNSGGTHGNITWGAAFKLGTWTKPANGFSRSIQYEYDGTNWVEDFRSSQDVPN